MFLRNKMNIPYILGKGTYFNVLNSGNLKKISKRKISKIEKAISDDDSWNQHKWFVFWKWINENFSISESFITRFYHNTRKLGLKLSTKEDNFIFSINGLYFATWRPLKEMLVKFKLDKKEIVYFFESASVIYDVEFSGKKLDKYENITSGDLFFSNQKLYVCDQWQRIKYEINYDDIKDVELSTYGTLLHLNNKILLIRSSNKYMSYIVFQRLKPSLKLDINKTKNLYNYFDFWNKVRVKFD